MPRSSSERPPTRLTILRSATGPPSHSSDDRALFPRALYKKQERAFATRWRSLFRCLLRTRSRTFHILVGDRTYRLGSQVGETRNTFDIDFIHHFNVLPRQNIIWGLGARWTRATWRRRSPGSISFHITSRTTATASLPRTKSRSCPISSPRRSGRNSSTTSIPVGRSNPALACCGRQALISQFGPQLLAPCEVLRVLMKTSS